MELIVNGIDKDSATVFEAKSLEELESVEKKPIAALQIVAVMDIQNEADLSSLIRGLNDVKLNFKSK